MKTIRLRSWTGFKALIYELVTTPPAGRGKTWFRGHGDARWSLQTTLDRFGSFQNREQRSVAEDELLANFRRELVGLDAAGQAPDGVALELLARHHGLPSALMDWTESPYVAAFFAMEGAFRSEVKAGAVWALNLSQLPATPGIEPIDDRDNLWFNPCALSQSGVFLRIDPAEGPAEEVLDQALTKMVLPASECRMALMDLEAMNITARNLFHDLDGAARTAVTRFQLRRAERG